MGTRGIPQYLWWYFS